MLVVLAVAMMAVRVTNSVV
jgi:hypothetical protein